MRIFRRVTAGLAIAMIPFGVGFPVALFPPPGSDGPLLPREALMAQLTAALHAADETQRGVGLIPALIAVGILLAAATWLALRQRPREARVRAPRASRAALALELIRRGQAPEDVIVRARLSRDAIELLRHTTMGQPVT